MASKILQTPYGPVELDDYQGEPTAADLEQLGRQVYKPSETATAESQEGRAAKVSTGLSPMLGGAGPFMQPETTTRMGANYVRYAPPLAAGMAMGPVTGLAAALKTFGAGATTGVGSEMAARFLEDKPLADREAAEAYARTGISSGFPMFAGPTGGGALKVGARILGAGVQSALTDAAAETAGRSIREGEFSTYKSLKEASDNLWKTAAIGTGMGSLADIAGGVAYLGDKMKKAALKLDDMGVAADNRTYAMLNDKWAQTEIRLAQQGHPLAQKLKNAQSDIERSIYGSIGDAYLKGGSVSNAQIASEMGKYVGVADELAENLSVANKEYESALQKLALAKKDTSLSAEQSKALIEMANAELLNSINNRAGAIHKASAFADTFVSPSTKAEEMGRTLKELTDVRSAISDHKYGQFYGAVGADENTPIFDLGKIVFDLEAALGTGELAERKVNDLVAAIKKYPVGYKKPRIDSLGQAILDKEGNPVYDQIINHKQLKELKAELGNAAAARAPGTVTAEDRTVDSVYNALKEAAYRQLAPDAATAIRAADKFYADTSAILQSTLAKAFLTKATTVAKTADDLDIIRTADHTIERVANGILSGQHDEAKSFVDFVNLLNAHNQELPEGVRKAFVPAQAIDTLAGAVRNAVFRKMDKTGVDGALADLERFYKTTIQEPSKSPLMLENLKLGNIETIRNWRKANRTYGKDEVTASVVSDVLQDPIVRKAMVEGTQDAGKLIDAATAESIFRNKVMAAAAQREGGKLAEAVKLEKQAADLAAQKGISSDVAKQAFEDAMKDPIKKFFQGKGAYTFADGQTPAQGAGTIADYLNKFGPDTQKALMKTLAENNPQVHSLVKQKFVASFLEDLVKPVIGGDELDITRVRDRFTARQLGNDAFSRMTNALGGDDKTVTRINQLATTAEDLYTKLLKGRPIQDTDVDKMLTIVGAQAVPVKTFRVEFVNRMMNSIANGAYRGISYLATDPSGVPPQLWQWFRDEGAGSLQDALRSMAPVKAYIIMQDAELMDELNAMKTGDFSRIKAKKTLADPKPSPLNLPDVQPKKKVSFQTGQRYRDANGNVRIYDNGKWVDPAQQTLLA